MRPALWKAIEAGCIAVAVAIVVGAKVADAGLDGWEMAKTWWRG